MAIRSYCFVALFWPLGFSATASGGDHLLLNATFNGETVGLPPGTGGAAAGEPIAINCGGTETDSNCVTVATAPFSTPNLQIHDSDTYYGQFVAFGFLDNEEVATGTVQIRAHVLFSGSDQPFIGLREQGSSAEIFLNMYSVIDSNYLNAYIGNTFHPGIGQFTANMTLPLEIDASADQKLISVRLGGATLLDRANIDLTGTFDPTRGIGTILVGVNNTVEIVPDVMRIDDLYAIACASATFADCLFVGSFDK